MSICHNEDKRIYGLKQNGKWYVGINDKIYKSKPLSSQKELNEAVKETYLWMAKKTLAEQSSK